MNKWDKIVESHKQADESCGRAWECACGACNIARNFEAANRIEFEDVSRAGSRDNWWLVKRNGRLLGMITKFKPSPGDIHPWKAFLGIGANIEFLGVSFHSRDEAVAMIVRASAGIFVGTKLANKNNRK